MRTYGLTDEQQDQVWAALRAGESISRIARHHRLPDQHVRRFLAQTRGRPSTAAATFDAASERRRARGDITRPGSRRVVPVDRRSVGPLSCHDRAGGRPQWRAHRVPGAGGGCGGYERGRRPKPTRLAHSSKPRTAVESGLELEWSPQQISARLVIDYPEDTTMRVSHESIDLPADAQSVASRPAPTAADWADDATTQDRPTTPGAQTHPEHGGNH